MVRNPRIRTLGAAALAVLLPAIVAAPASTATGKKTYNVKVQVFDKQNPRAPGECGLILVAAFPRVKYASSASVTVRTTGGQRSFGAQGPGFHDVLTIAAIFEAPTDKHWVELGYGSQAGGQNADCSEQAARAGGDHGPREGRGHDREGGRVQAGQGRQEEDGRGSGPVPQGAGGGAGRSNAAQLSNVEYGDKLDKRAASEVSRVC